MNSVNLLDMIYLDYAAATPLDRNVKRLMDRYSDTDFGNPSAIYSLGRRAKEAISLARKKIGAALHCREEEIIFTGGATEADNLAILGVARANREVGNKIILSAVEHKAALACSEVLRKDGFEVVHVPVNKQGIVDLKFLEKELSTKEKTILVSVCYADSETGTIQPIKEVARLAKKAGAYFHTDASQAATFLELDTKKLGVDLMTFSGHKLYGPKGVACLFARSGIRIEPLIYGGGQEGGRRAGTENVSAIVGFGEAVEINEKKKKSEGVRLAKLRDELEREIFKKIPKVVLNGHPKKRLPNFLDVSFLDIEGESLSLWLDDRGVVVNTGSACNASDLKPSHVLLAHGKPYEQIHGSIRFSLGRETSKVGIKHVLKCLEEAVEKLRRMSPMNLEINQTAKIAEPKAFLGGKEPHFVKNKNV